MMNFEQFANFLKKHSTIPNTFIDDFFSFYKYTNDDEDIIINLELVAKWLNMRKDHLKATLERSYIKNVDYNITKNKSDSKGRPSETILISTSCFKRLSMNSNTSKGAEVRLYYEQIEKLLHKYKDYIIEALEKKVGILENNQKPKIDPKNGLIYFIRSELEPENVFKLGKSKKFKQRFLSHNSSHADDLQVVLIYETDDYEAVEGCLKGILKSKQYRKRKEIYQVDIDVLKEVLKGCDRLVKRAEKIKRKKEDKTQKRSTKQKDDSEYNYFLYFDKSQNNDKPVDTPPSVVEI